MREFPAKDFCALGTVHAQCFYCQALLEFSATVSFNIDLAVEYRHVIGEEKNK